MKKHQAIEAAAQGVLVAGEQITSRGVCWAVQAPPRKPLLFLARRQYLLVLTDRRLLVFRRRAKPTASDLVIAKRYEAFTLERVSRSRPLMQVRLLLANGIRFVFEFRPRQRDLGGELVARLTPRTDTDEPSGLTGTPEPAVPIVYGAIPDEPAPAAPAPVPVAEASPPAESFTDDSTSHDTRSDDSTSDNTVPIEPTFVKAPSHEPASGDSGGVDSPARRPGAATLWQIAPKSEAAEHPHFEPGDSEPGDSEPADFEPADFEPADADSEPDDSEPDDSEPAPDEPDHDDPAPDDPADGPPPLTPGAPTPS